jgi:WD40 repeat protein
LTSQQSSANITINNLAGLLFMLNSRRCSITPSTVAFSPDGQRYLWAGGDPGDECSITLCNAADDKVLRVLSGHKKPVLKAKFLDDGSVISFSFDSEICRWSPDGELELSNKTHLSRRADGFALSANGQFALTGDYGGEITGWNLKNGKKEFALKESDSPKQIWALAISPNGKQFVSGGAGGTIRIWDLAKRQEKSAIQIGMGCHIQALAHHPEGKRFAAAIELDGLADKGARSRVILFEKGKEVLSLFTDGHQPYCCVFNRDGRLIAAAGGGTDRGANESKANCLVRVWDASSGKEVSSFAGHTGLVRDLAFSPDSKSLLSAAWDNTVRQWQIP